MTDEPPEPPGKDTGDGLLRCAAGVRPSPSQVADAAP
jgi:hypothetical protein